VAALLLPALYLPFVEGARFPLGAVPNVVAHIRFNGPVFRAIAGISSPQAAAAAAVFLGLAIACWARRRLPVSEPAAWAWPMAVSLACAPVIYPWYLLYLTPFLWTRTTIPLAAWTLSSLSVYAVWERARHGARWIVPIPILILEFGIVLIAGALVGLGERARERAHASGAGPGAPASERVGEPEGRSPSE
jgi:hypothetical protein